MITLTSSWVIDIFYNCFPCCAPVVARGNGVIVYCRSALNRRKNGASIYDSYDLSLDPCCLSCHPVCEVFPPHVTLQSHCGLPGGTLLRKASWLTQMSLRPAERGPSSSTSYAVRLPAPPPPPHNLRLPSACSSSHIFSHPFPKIVARALCGLSSPGLPSKTRSISALRVGGCEPHSWRVWIGRPCLCSSNF